MANCLIVENMSESIADIDLNLQYIIKPIRNPH